MAGKPFEIDITARDKTQAGVKSVEKRFQGMERSTDRLNRQTDRWAKGSGFGVVAKGLNGIAGAGANAAGGLASALEGTVGLGAAVSTTTWMLGGLTSAAFLAAGATVKLGLDWAKATTQATFAARGIGMAAQSYQQFQVAGRFAGVDPAAMAATLASVGDVFQDAAYGRNPEAQGMLNQLGIRLKKTKDGAIDVKAAMLDIAGAMEGRSAQTQRKIAQVLGVDGALPFLNRGRAAAQRDLNDALASGAVTLDKNRAAAEDMERQIIKMDLAWAAVKKNFTANWIIPWLKPAVEDLEKLTNPATSKSQARKMLDALPWNAGPRNKATGFNEFAARIARRESPWGQFRNGKTVVSHAGAIGAMQLMPETARRTAEKHGIVYNQFKLYGDEAYNKKIGRLHLWDLLQKYKGSEVLAAAAYNAGEGRLDGMWKRDRAGKKVLGKDGKPIWLDGWLKTIGNPLKGEISEEDFAKKINIQETRDYVMATAGVGGTNGVGKATIDVNFRNTPTGATIETGGDKGAGLNVKVDRSMPTQ